MCIRIGNLMNSEIIGRETNLPWGFRFIQDGIERSFGSIHYFNSIPYDDQVKFVESIPARHPSQLYESIFFLFLLVGCYFLWQKKKYKWPAGFMFGLFISILFTFRFCIEFVKEVQVSFESSLPIDMGQLLSLPFIAAGIFIMILARKKNKFHAVPKEVGKK